MRRRSSERRVLDEAGGMRAMTGVMAVMLFLTVLAAAAGLATRNATAQLDRQLAGRLTVQLVDGEPARRDAGAARVLSALQRLPEVRRAVLVDRAELARLLRPWLGGDAADAELPVPALIDVDLTDPSDAVTARVTAVARAASPAAQVDRRARWMSPVGSFMRSLTLIAGTLVLLMAGAATLVAVLAARAGLETHRATIEVMHMLGSTDIQVARLFQRRVAIDATLGGGAGAVLALGVAWLIGGQVQALGSELLGGASLGGGDWLLLGVLPVAFVVLATLAARWSVVRVVRRTL
ncbi:cell division protein FtsX [Sphingomonas sp.]|uniref:cell division protein FtsX n=1 Tax=Sphingomonas sp. TaxID=28214 RepID=UPI003CC598FC